MAEASRRAGAKRPSSEEAVLRTTNGRSNARVAANGQISSSAASARTPTVRSTAAPRIASKPPPATAGFGSAMATTTRRTPERATPRRARRRSAGVIARLERDSRAWRRRQARPLPQCDVPPRAHDPRRGARRDRPRGRRARPGHRPADSARAGRNARGQAQRHRHEAPVR